MVFFGELWSIVQHMIFTSLRPFYLEILYERADPLAAAASHAAVVAMFIAVLLLIPYAFVKVARLFSHGEPR